MKRSITLIFATAVVLSLSCGTAVAGEEGNQKANAAVVGIWELSTPMGVYAVARFAADGTIIQANFDSMTGNHMGSAIGEWRRCSESPCTAADKNRFEFILYMYDGQYGQQRMRIRARFTIEGDTLLTDSPAGDVAWFDFLKMDGTCSWEPGVNDECLGRFGSFPLVQQGKRLPFLRPPS